ncbi:hypothetical protein EUTSA_v10019846mg [Eutrema salsugineum]|uniref:RING-type domain-containing protein n=1 Tax=Eutrema salsugineum TaxID=72664 RepID=V4M854_EUTSA|nr:hypothetical protein EUTSA_v10019846mg [Eutrema salsugineum]
MKSRLCDLRLYKFDVPYESDVGVMRGRRRGSKAGLSKSFVDLVGWSLAMRKDSNLTNQTFDYIVSNFCFKDLEVVPPACPVLVFHFQTRSFGQDYVPEIHLITRIVLGALRTRDSVLDVEDATNRVVPIAPPTTEIVDGYQSSESCRLCEKGYPKEDEIVHKTRCNHIFHGTCISRYLLHTPQCPVCSAHLPPVDIRTLLFS